MEVMEFRRSLSLLPLSLLPLERNDYCYDDDGDEEDDYDDGHASLMLHL